MNWEDSKRDDLKAIPLAIENGWTFEFNYRDKIMNRTKPEHPPLWPVWFWRGTYFVWQVNPNTWAKAKLKKGKYIDHEYFDSPQKALS